MGCKESNQIKVLFLLLLFIVDQTLERSLGLVQYRNNFDGILSSFVITLVIMVIYTKELNNSLIK